MSFVVSFPFNHIINTFTHIGMEIPFDSIALSHMLCHVYGHVIGNVSVKPFKEVTRPFVGEMLTPINVEAK